MALLSNGTDPGVKLRGLHSVGRSPSCDLRVMDARVSAHHAEVRWSGSEWEVVDLASTNGTWVGGRRLSPREHASLAIGEEVCFGAEELRWRLVDAAPPAWSASEGDAHVDAVGGMLFLPGDDGTEAIVYTSPAGEWVVEQGGDIGPIAVDDVVRVGGRAWRLDLGPPPTTATSPGGPSIYTAELLFEVSADEEYTELAVRYDARSSPLGALSCFYTLLCLARHRLADAAAGVASGEEGWMELDTLARQLRSRESQINLDVHRIRQRFAAAGFPDAANIVERRRYRKQLRIGTPRLTVRRTS
jgi:hypothetical protein